MSNKAKIDNGHIVFFCPGCMCAHRLCVDETKTEVGEHVWEFSGSLESPTLSPSINDIGVCHSYVENGSIRYLPDCTHRLKNQTVELPPWNSEEGTRGN